MIKQFDYDLCKDLDANCFSKQSKLFYLDGKTYVGYGIRIHTGKDDFDIDDISIFEEDIDRLVNILNEEDISLTHIENIIEDFLCQINSLC